jgi:hypothetical protein
LLLTGSYDCVDRIVLNAYSVSFVRRREDVMRRPTRLLIAPPVAAALLLGMTAGSSARATSSYDSIILSEPSIVTYLPGSNYSSATEPDRTGHGYHGIYSKGGAALARLTLPNGEMAPRYNGRSQHLDVADADALSATTTGQLTTEAWIRPDTTSMPKQESSGYVMWMGKGSGGQSEYGNRMYQDGNSEDRANRISGYVFNRTGGLGVGGYFQDTVRTTQWVQVTTVIDLNDHSLSPFGLIRVYKNAALRQTTGLTQSYATISAPGNGTAPLRIATRDLVSYFKGGIGKVTIYNTALPSTRIAAHYSAMCPRGAGTPGCS